LLAIDPQAGWLEFTTQGICQSDEKGTNKARQRLARETGIRGGIHGRIADIHHAKMQPYDIYISLVRLQSLCTTPAARDREHISLPRVFILCEILDLRIDSLYRYRQLYSRSGATNLCSKCTLCCGSHTAARRRMSALCGLEMQQRAKEEASS
jgi:hypothetical protein